MKATYPSIYIFDRRHDHCFWPVFPTFGPTSE